MLRRLPIVLVVAALVAACARTGPASVKAGAAKPKPSPSVTVAATPNGPDLLVAPKGDSTELSGTIAVDAAYAIEAGAAKIVSDNGGGLVANNGGSLLANSGSNMVGGDPAQITSHLGAALTGKVKLISDHGGGIIANNGGGIIANNGGGIVSDHGGGWRLLDVAGPAHKAAPVGGMLVGVQSLTDGAFLPLGVDRNGKAVYAVYTDAKGAFKVHLPPGMAHNVLVVASIAGTQDTRLAVDLLARPTAAKDLQVDDATTLVTTYLRRAMIRRVEEVVDPDPCMPTLASMGFAGSALAIGLGAYQDLLTGEAYKALPREARRRVLVRLTDALLGQLDVEHAQVAPGLEPGAKVTGAALPVLKGFMDALEHAAAERLAADPAYFDKAFYVKVANLDRRGRPAVQIRKPSDLSEFIVDDFLATNDVPTAIRTEAIMVDLGLPTQWYLDVSAAGGSLIAAMGQTLADAEASKLVRQAVEAAIKDEAGAKPAAEASCVPAALPTGRPGTPALFAGTGHSGHEDGPAATARLDGPARMVVDPAGLLIVSDGGGHRLRKIDLNDPAHLVTTLGGTKAGDVDGALKGVATFNNPCGLALDGKGNLYVAERDGHRIRKVTDYLTDHAMVSTFAGTGTAGYADGPGASAQFNDPQDLAFGPDGTLYVADTANYRIRTVSPDGTVGTLAGSGGAVTQDGQGLEAGVRMPRALVLAPDGFLLAADNHDGLVRRISTSGGVLTLAGTNGGARKDGTYWSAGIEQPLGLAVAKDGTIYVCEGKTGSVRVITPEGFVGTLVAPGADTTGGGLALGPDGTLYIADPKNDSIRAIKP
jgi:sugar lactone lactonase YvrE